MLCCDNFCCEICGQEITLDIESDFVGDKVVCLDCQLENNRVAPHYQTGRLCFRSTPSKRISIPNNGTFVPLNAQWQSDDRIHWSLYPGTYVTANDQESDFMCLSVTTNKSCDDPEVDVEWEEFSLS